VSGIAKNIAQHSPQSKILVITNPMDVMTYLVWKSTGFPKERVFGQGNFLDSMRFRYLTGKQDALVIGEHGESIVPLGADVNKMREKIVSTNNEVLKLKGATCFGAAVAVTAMVHAVVKDTKEQLPVSVYLDQYGVYAGALAKLGKNGVEEVVLPDMTDEEKAEFEKSVAVIKESIDKVSDIV